MYRAILIFVLILNFSVTHSVLSQLKLDSLVINYQGAPEEKKSAILLDIAHSYYATDLNLFKLYVDSALVMLDGGNQNNLARIENYYGDYHDRLGGYDSAIYFYKKSIEWNELAKDKIGIAKSTSKVGRIFYKLGRYDKASKYLFEAVRIAENSGDQLTIALCYQNIGHLNYGQKKFIEAILYQKKARLIYLQEGNLNEAGTCEVNIGNAFNQLDENDSALYYMKSALAQFIADQDTLAQSYPLNNIALVLNDQQKYQESISNLKQALAIRLKYNEPRGISFGYNYIGYNHREMGNFKLAIDNYLKSLDRAIPINYYQLLKNSYYGLAASYDSLGQYKNAYKYHKLMVAVSDTLFNRQKVNALADAQTKYETEKKEQKIVLLDAQNQIQTAEIEKNKLIFISSGVALIVLILFVFLFYKQRSYKLKVSFEKERANLKSEQMVAVIASQEKERKRFAMDLHDDFGQLLSAVRLSIHSFKGATAESTTRITTKSDLLIDNMYSSLKNIAFDLMPHTLFEKGLEEALDELKDQINNTAGIKLSVQSFGIKDKIEGDKKIAVYRIIQEFINNIIKYADARNINISITDLGTGFSLMIEDDGMGYDLSKFVKGQGNGWKNISSRLDLINGSIEFDTMAGRRNTTVSIDIPYVARQQNMAA